MTRLLIYSLYADGVARKALPRIHSQAAGNQRVELAMLIDEERKRAWNEAVEAAATHVIASQEDIPTTTRLAAAIRKLVKP